MRSRHWFLIVACVISVFLCGFFAWYIRPSTATERTQFLQLLAQIGGALAFFATLYFAWRNLKNSQDNLRLSQEGQITERFGKAIEQLGDQSLAIRLGGIYALERIARDSNRDHWPIMEILTAYVREHACWKESDTKEERNPVPADLIGRLDFSPIPSWKNQEHQPLPAVPSLPKDIQAILTVLGRRTRNYENENQDLNLEGTDLRQAKLSMAHLERAILHNAHLERATLICAYLEGASLIGTHLEEAWCQNANFRNVNFSCACLSGALLNIADLEGADLSNAIGLTSNQIKEAINYDKAKLPNYLDPTSQ